MILLSSVRIGQGGRHHSLIGNRTLDYPVGLTEISCGSRASTSTRGRGRCLPRPPRDGRKTRYPTQNPPSRQTRKNLWVPVIMSQFAGVKGGRAHNPGVIVRRRVQCGRDFADDLLRPGQAARARSFPARRWARNADAGRLGSRRFPAGPRGPWRSDPRRRPSPDYSRTAASGSHGARWKARSASEGNSLFFLRLRFRLPSRFRLPLRRESSGLPHCWASQQSHPSARYAIEA